MHTVLFFIIFAVEVIYARVLFILLKSPFSPFPLLLSFLIFSSVIFWFTMIDIEIFDRKKINNARALAIGVCCIIFTVIFFVI